MRSGGAFSRQIRTTFARIVAIGAVASLGLGVAAATAAAADDPTTAHTWAITRDADGHLHVVRGIQASVSAMDARLGRTSTQVLSMDVDTPVHALMTNDPIRPQQWALNAVPYEASWGVANGSPIKVAIVDTGVLAAHVDLVGRVIPGTDLADDAATRDPAGTGMVDPGGHGTHVAGVIAALTNNGVGVAGAAPGAKILPVRVLDAAGGGSSADVAEGIIWATDHGARVINLSLGGGADSGMQVAMQYARAHGAVVVAAAGNNYQTGNAPVYPAAYPEAIAVGAVDSNLVRGSFSNTGSYVDVVAPGVGIVSTYSLTPDNKYCATCYAWMSGTSMATPYVSAEAALVISGNPKLDAAEVTNAIEGSARDLGPRGRDDAYGYGLVNPRGALLATTPTMINRGTKGHGYWVVGADGRVQAFGGAHWYGDLRGKALSAPIVAASRTPTGHGYWLAGADGAVYAFGDAPFLGSMRGTHLNQRIVGMAAMPVGHGYILLGQDGGIFNFGNSHFYGSTGGWKLNAPVLDMTLTSDGKGYWFVAADGGVFSFGDARFHGSTGGMRLSKPVRSMTAAADGHGYWMIADDGGVFAFNVPFQGSIPGVRALFGWPYISSIRMRSLPTNDGYYVLGANGSVWAIGNAKYFGSGSPQWAVDLMQAP